MDELTTKEKWGTWVLSDEALSCLRDEEVDEEEVCDKYSLLIEGIKSAAKERKFDMSLIQDNLMSDYLPFDSIVISEPSVSNPPKKEDHSVSDLVQRLVTNVKGNVDNVQEVIELVSNTNNKVLTDILSDVWEQLKTDEEKKTFIKLISACATPIHLFCENILLSKLKEEKYFHGTIEIVYDVAQLLESHLVTDTILPLLKDSKSLLVSETTHLKRCIDSFSTNQKSDFISGYIDAIESRLERHHLQVLETILENIPLNHSTLSKLVDLISASITEYNEDRSFGKILLLIADNITADTPKNVVSHFSLVCNNFKGTLRFRIKAAIKKKIST